MEDKERDLCNFSFEGRAPRILIVQATFYPHISKLLLSGAKETLERCGVSWSVREVMGALDVPHVIALACAHTEPVFDGFVALGCVIRGQTSHYDLVAQESCSGLMALSLRGVTVANGILTVENESQALERAAPEKLNKGGFAARACLQLVHIKFQFQENACKL